MFGKARTITDYYELFSYYLLSAKRGHFMDLKHSAERGQLMYNILYLHIIYVVTIYYSFGRTRTLQILSVI